MQSRCRTTRSWRRTPTIGLGLVVGLLIVLGGWVETSAQDAGALPAPNWAAIFRPDGSVADLRGGSEANFMSEKISNGIGVDMSMRPQPQTPLVNNGVVSALHDLGNGYLWVTTSATGETLIYVGVERLSAPGETYVEFELNQDVVKVHSGVPWPIHGGPAVNDLRVRLLLLDSTILSADFKRWNGTSYDDLFNASPDGCVGTYQYRFCDGAPPIQSDQPAAWDASYQIVEVPRSDRFVEIGINVAALAGPNTEFTSILVRTPQDIILDSFRACGYWARRGHGGGGQ